MFDGAAFKKPRSVAMHCIQLRYHRMHSFNYPARKQSWCFENVRSFELYVIVRVFG